jgi:diaminohydroxyphosphoribosylaminopyrimidine deaminase/5-amino-6-(5-phosphoribosylamino)uracil reductase
MSLAIDEPLMRRALELAARGQGSVEPNPMVGCVIARDGALIAEGWHRRFGGPHAEADALRQAGAAAEGATLYVTLEPCCHHGKTPPCTEAILAARPARVVVAMRDPFPQVSGGGLRQLQGAGIDVELGLLEEEARELNAPYLKLLRQGRPWVIGKWAMTLDGKIATRSGYSRWISGEDSRAIVQQIRGRVDAILIGRRTAEVDDPLLTARPAGPRMATRIVVDSRAHLSLNSQLVKTARQAPLLVAAGPEAAEREVASLRFAGAEVVQFPATTQYERTLQLLEELGKRRMTNVLVEGGSKLFGTLLDGKLLDELHVFIAPKLFGGDKAPSPTGGAGVNRVEQALELADWKVETTGSDIHLFGRIRSASG